MISQYIALDTETTGLNPAKDRVLEIGAARICDGKVCGTFDTIIDTGVEIPERIVELTGITDEMQKTGKKPQQAFTEFLELKVEQASQAGRSMQTRSENEFA